MKARMTFDTLAYANRLKAAGLESKIAETQAQANAEMLASLTENLVMTKQDLIGFATKEDLAPLATKQDLYHLENKMELRLDHMELRFEHYATKENFTRLETRIERLEAKLERLSMELTIRLGGIIVISTTCIMGIFSFFHGFH